VQAETVACDAHPGYASRRWAQHSGLPLMTVFHHRAHAAMLAAEYPQEPRWLVFTWDGVGYGEDGSLWGGEAMLGRPGDWSRAASLRPFRLPGGERAAREPWRSALALCWESRQEWPGAPADTELLRHAWARGLNSPQCSAAGRLFDAAAALLGQAESASFEGQGPMRLEAVAGAAGEAVPLPLQPDGQGVWRSDWAPLLPLLLDEDRDAAQRAASFHASLADALVGQACRVREQVGDFCVGLSGGVFQNRLLAGLVVDGLQQAGLRVRLPQSLPVNDGGLCVGQLLEAAALREADRAQGPSGLDG
jgi:hydrogenase maturation protein HypF